MQSDMGNNDEYIHYLLIQKDVDQPKDNSIQQTKKEALYNWKLSLSIDKSVFRLVSPLTHRPRLTFLF